MDNLENQIKIALTDGIKPSDAQGLKVRLMSELHYKDPFYRKIHSVFAGVRPTVNSKVLMKEKLLTAFELEKVYWFVSPMFKKLTSVAVMAAFLFTIIVQPFSGTEVARASVGTRVTSYSGVATVVRNGEIFNIYKDFALLPDDLVQTGPGAYVEIVYADDSLTRLGSDTRVVLNQLEDTELDFNANFTVLKGQVWNNTLGLSSGEASTFKFAAANIAGESRIPAVFNIEVQDLKVRVTTLDNSINLLLNDSGTVVPAVLRKGQVVTVKKENESFASLQPDVIENNFDELDVEWLTSNFTQDNFYIKNLTDTKYSLRKSEVGFTPDSLFYPIKEFQRAAKLAFTFDPIRQGEIELAIANQKLMEAEALVESGKHDEANKLLAEYTKQMEAIAGFVVDLNRNPDGIAMANRVQRLELSLRRTLVAQKRSYKEILPSSETYVVKNAINEAELIVAGNTVNRQKVEIKQAQDALFEAKLLVKENNTDLAEASINKYVQTIEKVSDSLALLSAEQKEAMTSELAESNTAGADLLIGVIQDLNQVKVEAEIEKVDSGLPNTDDSEVESEQAVFGEAEADASETEQDDTDATAESLTKVLESVKSMSPEAFNTTTVPTTNITSDTITIEQLTWSVDESEFTQSEPSAK